MDALEDGLGDIGVSSVRIDGGTAQVRALSPRVVIMIPLTRDTRLVGGTQQSVSQCPWNDNVSGCRNRRIFCTLLQLL